MIFEVSDRARGGRQRVRLLTQEIPTWRRRSTTFEDVAKLAVRNIWCMNEGEKVRKAQEGEGGGVMGGVVGRREGRDGGEAKRFFMRQSFVKLETGFVQETMFVWRLMFGCAGWPHISSLASQSLTYPRLKMSALDCYK